MSDTPLLDGLRGHPRYEPLRLLKNGAFGSVVLAQDKLTGELVALKMLPRAQVRTPAELRQLACMEGLLRPGLQPGPSVLALNWQCGQPRGRSACACRSGP